MIDWMLLGLLSAVLVAEVLDALALQGLVRRCRRLPPRAVREPGFVRWCAEGFDHSRRLTGWLRTGCVVLALAGLAGAMSLPLVAASSVLALGAHYESRWSVSLRRRFLRVVVR
jgi:hypothetical protein